MCFYSGVFDYNKLYEAALTAGATFRKVLIVDKSVSSREEAPVYTATAIAYFGKKL